MRERCCRCHTILTSEDKYHYGANCENCEVDYRYEEAEKASPIKSAHWRWRAICFAVRFLFGIAGACRDLLLQRLRNRTAGRSQFQNVWRKR